MEISTHPIDRICIGDFQLLCFPNNLCLASVEVNSSQFVYYRHDKCAVIKQADFTELLIFLFECCQILEKKPTNFEHKLSLQLISCEFIVKPDITQVQISNTVNGHLFAIVRPLIPVFISATTRLVLKTYCYSHSVTYTINKYIATAELEAIKKPDIETTFRIFDTINCVTIDYYLLFDIVERHKKLLALLKPLTVFTLNQ